MSKNRKKIYAIFLCTALAVFSIKPITVAYYLEYDIENDYIKDMPYYNLLLLTARVTSFIDCQTCTSKLISTAVSIANDNANRPVYENNSGKIFWAYQSKVNSCFQVDVEHDCLKEVSSWLDVVRNTGDNHESHLATFIPEYLVQTEEYIFSHSNAGRKNQDWALVASKWMFATTRLLDLLRQERTLSPVWKRIDNGLKSHLNKLEKAIQDG